MNLARAVDVRQITAPQHGRSGARAIVAASVGNLLEWYDFAVYALFAIYIGENFFPSRTPGVDLVKAFLVFGVGFVVRPLGAVLIGAYGDRAGRKAALTATILLMAYGTGIIACTPSFTRIGIGAPLLLLTGRLLQGFSAGGEIGGAAAFLVEHAPARRRGLFAAWLQASMGMSNILGAVVALSVTSLLTDGQMRSWGWRIPFLLGLSIAPIGWYLRKTLEETPQFLAELARRQESSAHRVPLVAVFRDHRRPLLLGLGISILWAAAVYVLLIFLPVFSQKSLNYAPSTAFSASLVEYVVFVLGCFAAGALSDHIGRRRMAAIGAAVLLVGVLPLFRWVDQSRTMAALIIAEGALGLMVSSFTGVAPVVLSALFPTEVRATGVSLVYNCAITVFAGFAPAILTWLTTTASGSIYAPAWYVSCAAVPALIAISLTGRLSEARIAPTPT